MLIEKVLGGSVKLGDKIFAVMNKGEIVPTLVSRIDLVDKEVRSDSCRDALVQVQGLLSYPYPLYRAIGDARAAAVSMLEKQLQDESLTVREHKLAVARYEQYKPFGDDEQQLLNQLQPTNHYRAGADEWCTPEDFPRDYYKPGTSVFVVDLKHWRLIDGFVTEVRFNPSQKGVPFGYCCGDMVHVLHEHLYTDKHTALRYMSAKFAEALPGTLDPDRVPVVVQTSQKAATEKMAARTVAAMRGKLL